jgi:hypothetical protein
MALSMPVGGSHCQWQPEAGPGSEVLLAKLKAARRQGAAAVFEFEALELRRLRIAGLVVRQEGGCRCCWDSWEDTCVVGIDWASVDKSPLTCH